MNRTHQSLAAAPLRAIGFNEHLIFFDANRDQKISLRESSRGLERLGFGRLLAIPGALGINVGLSALGLLQGRAVNPANLPLPRTGFVRHTDTDLIDDEGSFDEAALHAAFSKYGKQFGGEALTLGELAAMLGARVLKDTTTGVRDLLLVPVGATAVTAEWGALFWVAASNRDKVRVLEKDTVRRFYTDPTFFEDVAQRIAAKRALRSNTPLGSLRNFIQSWLI